MVIKNDPHKLLDLLGTKHRETDPDDEFLDRLQKKTSFYDQPAAPPQLSLPSVGAAAAASLDDLADVLVVGEEGPRVLHVVEAERDAAEAEAERRRAQEAEKRGARFASLFEGRGSGGSDQTGVPDNISFKRISARPDSQHALPEVGTAMSPEEAAARVEDAARRAAWAELNRLREVEAPSSERYRAAHERYVATWGRPGTDRAD